MEMKCRKMQPCIIWKYKECLQDVNIFIAGAGLSGSPKKKSVPAVTFCVANQFQARFPEAVSHVVMPPGAHAACYDRSPGPGEPYERFQVRDDDIGNQVGHDDVIGPSTVEGADVRYVEPYPSAVVEGAVALRAPDRVVVDVNGVDVPDPELRRGNGKNAGAGAGVEQRQSGAPFPLDAGQALHQVFDAEPCGGVASVPEGMARVDGDRQGVGFAGADCLPLCFFGDFDRFNIGGIIVEEGHQGHGRRHPVDREDLAQVILRGSMIPDRAFLFVFSPGADDVDDDLVKHWAVVTA